jgi:hypothetical protein
MIASPRARTLVLLLREYTMHRITIAAVILLAAGVGCQYNRPYKGNPNTETPMKRGQTPEEKGSDPISRNKAETSMDTIVWNIDSTTSIGGHAVKVLGAPKVIDTEGGKAVLFDGVGDGLFIDALPVAGWKEFTVEVEFRPDAGGLPEQRYFHMQEAGTKNRIMLETRLTGQTWYSDAFMASGANSKALIDPNLTHPVGKWYTLRLTYDGKTMKHYVDGKQEGTWDLPFEALAGGTTSIGVRQNLVCWFKGGIRKAVFTQGVKIR